MTKCELKSELNKIRVSERSYSLNEGVKTDAYIIEKHNDIWKFYYFDEKGQESDYNLFKSEEDAYSFLLEKFKEQLKLLGKKSF
ncbi:hypothetical protein LS482_08615 [Sinomicrobium kalidii]|uniref:hypothetical protein n=1 Tax=Sinomicrobium kalidii TaxID=2900738 RepID=UPI001E53EC92|nr:hypothetical protein [Sinomicrobium kalidii]UGU17929.1 hypothetical protein LS482_08615 [Sinomicrobium kalidii]